MLTTYVYGPSKAMVGALDTDDPPLRMCVVARVSQPCARLSQHTRSDVLGTVVHELDPNPNARQQAGLLTCASGTGICCEPSELVVVKRRCRFVTVMRFNMHGKPACGDCPSQRHNTRGLVVVRDELP